MTQTLLYRDQKYTVYGWACSPRDVLAEATFSCPVTLKKTGEIFTITEAKVNSHKAKKTGKTEKTPEAVFL